MGSELIVISQLPPPYHGSTLMTRLFLGVLDDISVPWTLVDRRFSKSVSDVGEIRLNKILAAGGLLFRLFRTARKNPEAESVFFCTTRKASFLVDWLMSEILRRLRVRTTMYVHTVGYRALADEGPVWRFLVSRLLASASEIVCLTPILELDVNPFAHPEAVISSIPNSPGGTPRPERTARGTATSILFLSNLLPEKGASDFVQLGLELASTYPHIRFRIAGADFSDAYTNELRAQIGGSIFRKQFEFLGAVEEEQKWKLLTEADLLVFPSKYEFEAQPLTIIEAMAAGTPCVAYGMGGIPDTISDGRSGIVVDRGDYASLVRAVRRLLDDDGERQSMGNVARNLFDSKYSYTRYRDAWESVLRR